MMKNFDKFCSIDPGTGIAIGSAVSGLTGALGGSSGGGTRKLRKARGELRNNALLARRELQPYADEGLNAFNQYQEMLGQESPGYDDFQGGDRFNWDTNALLNDPGYQFTRDQALQGTTRQQNAGGNQFSGNILTALQDRAAGVAASYGQDFRRSALDENRTNYGRDVGEYGMGVARNQDLYGRDQNVLNRYKQAGDVGLQAAGGLSNIHSNLGTNLASIWAGAAPGDSARNQFALGSINNAAQGYISNSLLNDYIKSQQPNPNYTHHY